jgi:uncharacterized protein
VSQDFPRPSGPFRGTRATATRRPRALVPTLVVLGILAVLYGVLVSFWTDWLWFDSVGFRQVFTTALATRIGLFLFFGALMGAVVAANAVIAYRLRPRYRPMSVEQQSLERYREAIDPIRRWVVIGVAVLLGLMAGGSAGGEWQTFLLWRNGRSFGSEDPQLGTDIGFFAFDYPWWRFLVSFGFAAIILGLIAAAVTHYLYGGIRLQSVGEKVSPAAQAHLSALIGLFVLLKAVAYWLDRYGLLIEQEFANGLTGAGYTDINTLLPAKTILASISLICAALFFVNIWRRSWTLPGISLGLLVLSAVLLGGLWPAIVQQFRVRPSEADRESAFISENIGATRQAYGVAGVEAESYEATTTVEAGQLAQDRDTIPSIRLIDPNVVPPTFQQQQQVRGFYSFANPLDVDRYDVEDENRDMVVAVREIDLEGVPTGQQNWINQHTVYTHGFGMVAAYGNQRAADGSPAFAEEDIPPDGVLGDYEPRIYFGENSPPYSIVGAPEGSDPVEFDIPEDPDAGGQQRNNTYEGDGGVAIGSFVNRLLFATKFQEGNILLTDRINSDSVILYDRHPRDRVETVAPWLRADGNPYPAVVGERIVWIIDAYTTSNTYPYSQRVFLDEATSDSRTDRQAVVAQPQTPINYVRNSVKATVDAYTGEVTLYAWDETDPLLQAWRSAFPDSVVDRDEIPDELLDHLRYPEDLFKIQRELLSQYHVTEPRTFYGGQDFWTTPQDPALDTGQPQPPYYLTLAMPGDEQTAFSLTTTYVPRNRQNLAAFMAVNADARSEEYGTLRILRLPGRTQIEGPGQVANAFETNQQIAEATLPLRQSGAETREGNLLTLPVGGGLLYVQPLYVERRTGDATFPLLRLVFVSFAGRVGVGDTLQEALDAVFQGDAGTDTGEEIAGGGEPEPIEEVPVEPGAEPTTEPQPTPEPSPTAEAPASGTLEEALADAQQAFTDAEAAQRAGDWTAYGEALQRLEEALARANELSSEGGG